MRTMLDEFKERENEAKRLREEALKLSQKNAELQREAEMILKSVVPGMFALTSRYLNYCTLETFWEQRNYLFGFAPLSEEHSKEKYQHSTALLLVLGGAGKYFQVENRFCESISSKDFCAVETKTGYYGYSHPWSRQDEICIQELVCELAPKYGYEAYMSSDDHGLILTDIIRHYKTAF